MKINKFDLKTTINELQGKALENPVLKKKEILLPETIMDRSVIRPSATNKDKIVIATLIWYIPAAKSRFSSAFLFSLSETAHVLPKYQIQYTGLKESQEIMLWLPLIFKEIYDLNKLAIHKANDIAETDYNALFYIAYIDAEQNLMTPPKGKRIL